MFNNFANAYSTIDSPAIGSRNGVPSKVNINVTDTLDWKTTPEGDLICLNAGTWSILAQYQLEFVGFATGNINDIALIDGFFSINDVVVPASDATNSVSISAPKNVLPIGLCSNFAIGDKLSVNVASSNTLAGICRGYDNNGKKNKSYIDTNKTEVYAPSVIFTLYKIGN